MQILVVYLSFKVVLYWSCTGVVILYFNAFACICLFRGAGGIVRSFRPGSVRRRRAEVRPEAGGGWDCAELQAWLCPTEEGRGQAWSGGCAVGWEGWSFGLDGSLRWISAVEEVGKPKAQPVSVWVRLGGWSFGLWLVALAWGLEDVKAQSPAIAGQPATKIPKIPKIPIALDDSGELKQLP